MALASYVDEIRYLVRSRLDCQGEGENGTEPASSQPDRRDVRILGGGTDAGRQPAQPTGNVGTPGQRFGLLADAVADHLQYQGQSVGHRTDGALLFGIDRFDLLQPERKQDARQRNHPGGHLEAPSMLVARRITDREGGGET